MNPTVLSRRGSAWARRERVAAWAFILPFLVFFASMIIVPLLYSGWLSTFRSRLIGGQSFAGMANYVRAVKDPAIWRGVTHVLLFLGIAVPVQLCMSLFLALLFDAHLVKGARYGRLALFVPYAVPVVVGTTMWGFIYGSPDGLIAQTLHAFGIAAPNLLSSHWLLPSIMNITGWEYIGYNMTILYVALKTVPIELSEAAAIDGAGTWRTSWNVKLPAIRGALLLVILFSIIFSFQLFNEPSLLFNNAPTAIGHDFTPNLYAYNIAFLNQDVNYAATIAFVLGLITVIPSVFALRLFNREEDLR
jgi:multiple sugar transport system permease protein